jgi:hypothetical protein
MFTFVTHIDTNEHDPFFLKSLRELQSVSVATKLVINLYENSHCFGKSETFSIAVSNNLRRQFVVQHQVLERRVVVLK